jgi:hypothetical protein
MTATRGRAVRRRPGAQVKIDRRLLLGARLPPDAVGPAQCAAPQPPARRLRQRKAGGAMTG